MNKKEVINLINVLGSRIGVPYDDKVYSPIYDSFQKIYSDGMSIYIDERGDIHVAITSRGKLVSDETNPDPIVALYPVLEIKARSQAFEYGLANAIQGLDYRRVAFKKELELLEQILPQYAEIAAKKIYESLQRNPFMDGKPVGDFLDKYLGKE